MLVAAIIIALAPAVVCTAVLGAVRAWRPEAATRLASAVPVAVAAGFVLAQLAVDGAPRLPPIEASGWFSPLVVLFSAFAIAVKPRLASRTPAAATVAVVLVMVVIIVYPLMGGAWSIGAAVLWIGGMTLVASSVSWLIDRHPVHGPGAPASLLIAASGVAGVLALWGSARYGQLGGAVASAMGPLTLLGLLRRDSAALGSGAWLSVMILAMLVVAGVAYVDVPIHIALALMVAPLGILTGELLPRWPWWGRDLARCAVTLAFVGLAAALAAAGQSTAN